MKRITVADNVAVVGRCSPARTVLLFCCLLGAANANAAWFKNPAQEAAQKFEQGEYGDAANEFSDDYRRGVALYRAGRYTDE